MLTNGKLLDGRYQIREQIGSGGFGAVYLAEDTRFSGNNRVAIKQIASTNERVAKTSKIEADLLYNLSHPNLPKVTNCFQEDGASYIVMDYISGEDLAQKLQKKRKLSIEEVLLIADKVLDALEYLHSIPIYHRDIKPHNIKTDEKGRIFLLDFGTAKGNLDEEKSLKYGGQSITGYTPFYAPLEQVIRVDPNSFLLLNSLDEEKMRDFAERRTDARSDIYALGATIFHLLTGFSPEQATATIRAHALWSHKPDPLPNILSLSREISPALANAIHRALEVMPEHRFQTAKEFRQSLRNSMLASVPTQATEAVQFLDQPQNRPQNQPQNQHQQVHIAPTQLSPPVETKQNESVVTRNNKEFNLIPDSRPAEQKSGAGKYALLGAGAFVFFMLVGAGAFLAWKFLQQKPEPAVASQNTDENSKNAASRTLAYSLLVQKMRDGKKFQEPFESSGQEIFESGYQFVMNLTPSEKGFLYIFAEGLNERGEKVFNIIFPTPKQNGGLPDVSANQKYQTGWNSFSGAAGTENFWLIWNREKPQTAESARENAFQNGGRLVDKDLEKKLKDFLEQNRRQKTALKDAEKKTSKIGFEGDSLVHLIQLEHR